MSWSDYVNNYLINYNDLNTGKVYTNVCEHGAIIGNQDGTIWASTPGFALGSETVEIEKEDGSGTEKVTVNEFASLSDAFNNAGKSSLKGGIRINKEKYYAVSFDGELGVLYLKKNGGGAAVAKSNLGFVIGTFNSKNQETINGVAAPQNPGTTNKVVEALQKFLLENNL
jgi:hypothetical protein